MDRHDPQTTVRETSVIAGMVERASSHSAIVGALRSVAAFLAEAFERSGIAQVVSAVRTSAEASFIYRWLMAEPDPEVVVIDLRETVALGPLLALLDRAVETFPGFVSTSSAYQAGERTIEFAETEPIQKASVLLLAAVVAHFGVAVVLGSMDTVDLFLGLGLGILALLGLRIDASMAELRETRTARLLVTLLEPPDPPDEQ